MHHWRLLCGWWFIGSSLAYRYVIVPGLGGSVLYNQKSQKIWPAGLTGGDLHADDLGMDPFLVPNVKSSLRNIGDLEGIRIDTHTTYFFTKNIYYATMIDYLQKRNHDVMAFPYDFRYILHKHYHLELYAEYKKFVEKEFRRTGEKVIFIAHSAGGLVIHHFMNSFVSEDWLHKHVAKVYYVSVPFGGCPDSLYFLIDMMKRSAQNLNIFKVFSFIPNFHLCGGFYLCLPMTNDPLLRKNGKWYYKSHVSRLLCHDPHTLATYQAAREFCSVRKKSTSVVPQVVVHGTGMNTTIFYDYDTHTTFRADGDSMVSTESLLFPKKHWKHQPLFVELKGKEHSRINNYHPLLQMISEKESVLPSNPP